MKRNRVIGGTVAVLVTVALASSAAPRLRALGRGSDVETFEVRRGEFTRRVFCEGVLESVEATVISPPGNMNGELKIAWIAPDGSRVAKDDLLVRFDPTDLEEQLVEGQNSRATADSRITQKSVRERSAMKNLERDSELADLELVYSRDFQSKDADIFSRLEIIESQIDGELATRKKQHADEMREIRAALSGVELDLLGIEKRKAQLEIDEARKDLERLEVRAPHDGIFLLRESWSGPPVVGATVWANNKLAEIPSLDRMQAKVFVLEADAGGLAPGIRATVSLDAHPGSVFPAVIQTVDTLAKRTNRRVPVQYFGVVLELEATDPERMKPGQRVQATLILDELTDVLDVPRNAVFEVEGESVVYVQREGKFEPVEVALGPAGLGRVVIESGLEPGDRIALRDPTAPVGGEGSGPSGENPAAPGPGVSL